MLKTLGILCVILGTSGTGISLAISVKKNMFVLQQFLLGLEQMKNEIEYGKTPLPELMRILSVESKGVVSRFWKDVASDLYRREDASVYAILKKNLAQIPASSLPSNVRQILLNLGSALGKYDVTGQMRALNLAISRLSTILTQLQSEQKARVRSYCTLGICAGLAIAILVI